MKNQHPPFPVIKTLLLATVMSLVLSACGNKGDLYLPEEPETSSHEQDSTP